jgi:hypothetical protein
MVCSFAIGKAFGLDDATRQPARSIPPFRARPKEIFFFSLEQAIE